MTDHRPGIAVDVEAVLATAGELVDSHRLAAAERLLGALVNDQTALADATSEQRCRVLIDWGWLHGATQRHDIAMEALTSAVQLAETIQSPTLLGEALREAAVVARYQGDFRGADALLIRAEHLADDNNQFFELSRTLFVRATIAHHLGAFTQARTLLDQAAGLAASCPPAEGTTLLLADIGRELGVSARLARDFDAARDLLAEARDRYASIGRRVGVANIERELGAVAESLGDFGMARRHHGRAFVAYLRAGRRMGAAQAARRLGHLDVFDGDADDPSEAARYARARRRFAQSLRLGGAEPTNALKIELFLGKLARLEGDLDQARRRLVAAGQGYTALAALDRDVARDLSEVAFELGRVAQARGDRNGAIVRFEQALAALRPGDDPGAASLNHYQLALEFVQADHIDEAAQHAMAAFTYNEDSGRALRDPTDRLTYYRFHQQTYDLARHCAARAGDGTMALRVAIASRSEALAAFVRTEARFAPSLRGLVDEITLANIEGDHDRLRELYQRLEHETSVQLRRSLSPGAPDLDEMIASLPPGGHALLVDVLESENSICNRVWVTPCGAVRVDEVRITARVRQFLDDYHAGTSGAAWRAQQKELALVGEAVIPGGLADALATGADPPLVISTSGVLSAVPVGALRVRGRYRAELARLAVVPSLALWPVLRRRPPHPGIGTLAFLDSELPGSAREERALRSHLPPLRRVDAQRLRGELVDARGYATVVVSAHGSAQSGLAHSLMLAPGDELTAADLLTCHLPDGLVMASCWSGRLTVRAAVEPLGLPTAALLAGARWVLAGTVDVGTTPTATLLTVFFARLASGHPPVDALHVAQRDYLRRRPQATPGTWAGMVVIGDGFAGI